jgi:hypothetical protein
VNLLQFKCQCIDCPVFSTAGSLKNDRKNGTRGVTCHAFERGYTLILKEESRFWLPYSESTIPPSSSFELWAGEVGETKRTASLISLVISEWWGWAGSTALVLENCDAGSDLVNTVSKARPCLERQFRKPMVVGAFGQSHSRSSPHL